MPYVAGQSDFTGLSKPAGQIAITQEVTTPSFLENKHIARAKEIQGGLHYVKYLTQLTVDNLYDGIFSTRRSQGMMCYVHYLDDDTFHGKMYVLDTAPGNNLSDWTQLAGGPITLNNPQTVANLTLRDALTPSANDFVNVTDARLTHTITNITQANPAVVTVDDIGELENGGGIGIAGVGGMVSVNGIYEVGTITTNSFTLNNPGGSPVDSTGYNPYTTGGTVQISQPYSRSYIYDGSSWLPVYGVGGIDPAEVAANTSARHNRNTDDRILRSNLSPVTADQVYAHMTDLTIHAPINDANPTGDPNELYSSALIQVLLDANAQASNDYTYSQAVIDQKVIAASLGISKTYATFALRNADNSVNNGVLAIVDEDRGVYRFTGVSGQSGAGFWDFMYFLDVTINNATANWSSPSDVNPVSQLAVENRIQFLIGQINQVQYYAANIPDRDALLGGGEIQDLDKVFVQDATQDPTVDFGWAIYQFLTPAGGWVKFAEQEAMDIDLSVYIPFSAIQDGSTNAQQLWSSFKIQNELNLKQDAINSKQDSALTEDKMWKGNASDLAEEIDTEMLLENNDINQTHIQSWLEINHGDYDMGQMAESEQELSIRGLKMFGIIKKYANKDRMFTIDINNVDDYWNTGTGVLNLTAVRDYELIKVAIVLPTFITGVVSNDNPALITTDPNFVKFLKNGDTIIFTAMVGMTELNGNTYKVAAIDYAAGTFVITDLADVPIDSTGFGTHTPGTGTFAFSTGKFEPEVNEVEGLLNNMTVDVIFDTNTDPTVKHVTPALATIDQIVTDTGADITIVGDSVASPILTIKRRGDINLVKQSW